MSDPKVSIIMASYNHGQFIGEAIASVSAQTYGNIELIVVDDASSDDTIERIERLKESHQFLFLRNERNIGPNPTLNRGLAHATGTYVGLLPSDDTYCPSKIEKQVAYMQAHDLDAVYSTSTLLHPDGSRTVVNLDRFEKMFADGSALREFQISDTDGPLMQSGLFRREVLEQLMDVRMRYKSDDWASIISLMERFRVGFLNLPLLNYRQHTDNTYRKYWYTFPMRAEVICGLTPVPLRYAALSNLLASQAAYLALDKNWGAALRFSLAAVGMNPSPRLVMWLARHAARGCVRRVGQRVKSLFGGKVMPGAKG